MWKATTLFDKMRVAAARKHLDTYVAVTYLLSKKEQAAYLGSYSGIASMSKTTLGKLVRITNRYVSVKVVISGDPRYLDTTEKIPWSRIHRIESQHEG